MRSRTLDLPTWPCAIFPRRSPVKPARHGRARNKNNSQIMEICINEINAFAADSTFIYCDAG